MPVPAVPPARRGIGRSRPIAALVEMLEAVIAPSTATSAGRLNEAHRLGESAAAALLDAGDLRGWELSTRVTAELCALAQTGWLPGDAAARTGRPEAS